MNKQLNEQLEQMESKLNNQQQTKTQVELSASLLPFNSNYNAETQQKVLVLINIIELHFFSCKKTFYFQKDNYDEMIRENADLKDRINHLEHVILQLQSETETIGIIQSPLHMFLSWIFFY